MARRKLDGKRIIVTGASSGIGRELARQLAAHQCRIVINARRGEKLEQLAVEMSQTGATVVTVVGDITSPDIREELVSQCLDRFGGVDIVVNNAGIGAIGDFAAASAHRLQRVMEVNFFAPAELTRLAIPHLLAGVSPLIVNVSSVLGHRAVPMKSEYCASKFALHGWSDALRAELASQGIDVLLVSPSTTDSEFFDNVIENSKGTYSKMSSAKSPAEVARRTVRAMQRGNHEIILSWSGWGLVWLDRLFPAIADRLVARYGND
jgi:short-subunit dehydrogenase